MNGQPELGKPFRNHLHDAPSIAFEREPDHEIIRKSDEVRPASQTRLRRAVEFDACGAEGKGIVAEQREWQTTAPAGFEPGRLRL